MKKFTVNVTETSYGFIEVEANSKKEALKLARVAFKDGNTYWYESEEEFVINKTASSEEIAVKGATLLSKEEATSLLTQEERTYFDWWWLRSPSDSGGATLVDYDGWANNYTRVNYTCKGIVRPALIINLESSDLKVGDIFEFGGREFKILSPTIAWMYKDNIGYCAFRKDWETDNANDYEASDVKKFVDEWFKAAKAF